MLASTVPCPPDSVLPVLPACLHSDAVLDAARQGLHRVGAEERERWQEARLVEALYHPGRYVRIVYAMLEDPATPASRAWPECRLVYLNAPVRPPVSRRGAILNLGGDQVEAYAFPNDRRLRGLRSFARRDLVLATWRQWAGNSEDRLDEETLQRKLVRYVPEQKCVVRLRAEWESKHEGKAIRRIAVRSCPSAVREQLAARHQSFTDPGNGCARTFVTPRVMGVDTQRGLLGVEWLRGETLVDSLRHTDERETMNRVAEAVHEFHQTPVPGLAMITNDGLAMETSDALIDLAAACPELGDPLKLLRSELPARLARSIPGRTVTLHNDLHWNQVSIKSNRLAFLDLERMATGDEWIDVANLATQIQMLGRRPDQDVGPATAERWADLFLSNWQEITGRTGNSARFHLLAARSRLQLARGMLRHLRPWWASVARECVLRALGDLALAEAGGGGP